MTAAVKILKGKKLDAAITAAFNQHGRGIQFNIMDLGKLKRDVQAAYEAGGEIDAAMVTAVAKYRVG